MWSSCSQSNLRGVAKSPREQAHIIGISETHLNKHILDSEIEMEGFHTERKDRPSGKGGGIVVYVSQSLVFHRRLDLEADGIECILMEVLFKKSKPLLVGQVYRPPNTSDYLPEDFNEKFETMLEKVCCEEKEALLLGDLNCDYKKEQNNRPLKSIASWSGFSQMVTSPTRITEETASLIDLVLTNMPQNITKAIACDSGCSDHCMIGTVRKLNSLRFKPRVLSCRNYKNYNSAKFNNDLKDAPWGEAYNASDLEKANDNFESIVAESVEKHAPMVQRKVRGLHCPGGPKK